MKAAYGTYAMPTIPLEQAFSELSRIGYKGVEICISSRHVGSEPDEIDNLRRSRLAELLDTHDLGVPALFVTGHLYHENIDDLEANMRRIRDCAQLARDLGVREPPVIAMGFGGKTDQWDDIKADMVDQLNRYAELSVEEDIVIAGEAHFGAALDRSERVTWLLDGVGHPRIRFHFDIVHLFLADEPIADAVRTLVPYTAHTHITDARRHDDGSFDLVLLGHGDLDATAYVKAMDQAGWDDFITLEVSTMVWSRDDYAPIEAAEYCYDSLTSAFEEAGVAYL